MAVRPAKKAATMYSFFFNLTLSFQRRYVNHIILWMTRQDEEEFLRHMKNHVSISTLMEDKEALFEEEEADLS